MREELAKEISEKMLENDGELLAVEDMLSLELWSYEVFYQSKGGGEVPQDRGLPLLRFRDRRFGRVIEVTWFSSSIATLMLYELTTVFLSTLVSGGFVETTCDRGARGDDGPHPTSTLHELPKQSDRDCR